MALLGAQAVFSLIVAFLISKFSGQFSFARWILCRNLARYLHPSDEELRKLAGLSGSSKSIGRGSKKSEAFKKSKDEPFTIPRTANIQLEAAPIKPHDLVHLQFYDEYLWLVDVALCGIVIHVITDLYYYAFEPVRETNLSILWCILLIIFCLKSLLALTGIYFKTEEGGERILCLLFGFFFLIFALAVLIIDENTLELGLENTYANFSLATRNFLNSQGYESSSFFVSLTTIKIILAIFCAILGATLTFPGLRLAKMHVDAIRYCKGNVFMTSLLYINFLFTLFLASLWIKPLFRDYLTKKEFRNGLPIMSDAQFDALRLGVLATFCLFRFSLIWTHLQAHLNIACDKIAELKKEVGRIGSGEVKKLVARVYCYLCIVALHYLTPLILILFLTLLLKTLGNFSIPQLIGGLGSTRVWPSNTVRPTFNSSGSSEDVSGLISSTAIQFSHILSELKMLFPSSYFYNLVSFFCWWTCTSWFMTTAFGVLYHTYFTG